MDLSEVSKYVIEGMADEAEEWTKKAIAEGMEPAVIVNEGLIPGMDVVGEKFASLEYFMPEMLVSARAMKKSMALLQPLLTQSDRATGNRAICGSVQGDLHDIGVSLVGMMLEGAGFEVTYLGSDNTPDQLLDAVEEKGAQVLCMSALITTTLKNMKATVDRATELEIRNKVLMYVGGAPVTQDFADQIGANGYRPDAGGAVAMIRADLEAGKNTA